MFTRPIQEFPVADMAHFPHVLCVYVERMHSEAGRSSVRGLAWGRPGLESTLRARPDAEKKPILTSQRNEDVLALLLACPNQSNLPFDPWTVLFSLLCVAKRILIRTYDFVSVSSPSPRDLPIISIHESTFFSFER